PVLRARVADVAHRLARDPRDVDVLRRRQLAGNDDQAGRDQGLAGDAALGVVRERGVENGVRDLVGDLVRVTLGHRLGREEEGPASHWRLRVPQGYDVLTYATSVCTPPSVEPKSSAERSGRRLFSTSGGRFWFASGATPDSAGSASLMSTYMNPWLLSLIPAPSFASLK